MNVIRPLSVSRCVWPPVCDGAVSQIWDAYRQLEATQWLSLDAIRDGQLRQLRELLKHCAANVPFYRQQWTRADIDPSRIQSLEDFRRLPVLPRRTYQQHQAEFVAEKLPSGTVATTTPQTSGSSGTPTRAYQTNLVNLWWYAFFLRDLEWCGIDPRGSVASIRSTGKRGAELQPFLTGVSAPCWLPPLQGLIEMGPAHLMDIAQEPRRQLEWLRRIGPDYLVSYPANLEVLAELVRRDGPIAGLRGIQSVSDTLTPEAQAAIEAAFQVPVKNTYSCVEAGYLASPCPTGAGLHVHSESVLLEVLNERDEPCGPGETGSVVLTTLHNFRGPLLRYELGDQVTLADSPCACGRGLPLLARVQGKNSPLFHLPDGRRKSSARLAFQIRKVGGHWQHQVVQRARDHVVVRMVRSPEWSEPHAERVRHEVQAFFEGPVRVDVELHEHLAPPPHGKFQNMIVELT